jgi:hypothetical protein
MATDEQRARRRAQRALAEQIRAGQRNILPKNLKGTARQANEAYARRVIKGQEPEPEPGSLEARNLARLASNSRWGKTSKDFSRFEKYWYHNKEVIQVSEDNDE